MQLAPALLRVPDGYWSNFVKDFPNHPVSQLQTVDSLPLALHADEGCGASQARSKTNCAHVLAKHATQLSVTLLTLRGKSNDYQLVDGRDQWPKTLRFLITVVPAAVYETHGKASHVTTNVEHVIARCSGRPHTCACR